MGQNREVASLIVLIVSLVVLTGRLFSSRTIQIMLENGQAVPLEGGSYFTFLDAIIMIVSAWVAGMAAFYIMRSQRTGEPPVIEIGPMVENGNTPNIQELALKLLEGDEMKVYKHILDSRGEILQKDLVMEMNFDKAKITRILAKLEQKDLILKIKHGMTNRIVLKGKE